MELVVIKAVADLDDHLFRQKTEHCLASQKNRPLQSSIFSLFHDAAFII